MALADTPRQKSAIGILSIGDMGVGIAKLLIAKGFTVVTNCSGRSEDTITRARDAGVELVDSDAALVAETAIIFSIVPPRDAVATAQRIVDALPSPAGGQSSTEPPPPLYFADLNAISPSTTNQIGSLLASSSYPVVFIDGCILGGPPRPLSSPDPVTNVSTTPAEERQAGSASGNANAGTVGWSVPGIPTSGPHSLASIPVIGPQLASVLGSNHISPDLGAASGLKMCFASLSKGFTALAVESFTTAHRLGVLPHLQSELEARLPAHARVAQKAVVTMPPKAYRWVREMEEISDTHRENGGFADEAMFRGAAAVFRAVAEDTVLGEEKIGKRTRGTTVEDLAAAVGEGLEKKRRKAE